MQSFVSRLKRQSPSPLASYGHGWLELPNGQRWQPSASEVVFAKGKKPLVQARRRSIWARLFGLRG